MADSAGDRMVLEVGDVAIEVWTNDDGLRRRLRDRCGLFEADRKPEFSIRIELDDTPTAPEIVDLLFNLHRIEVRPLIARLTSGRGLIHRSDDELSIRVHRDVFDFDSPNRPRLLNVLLCAAFNTVWQRQRRRPRSGFLFHGCGVEIDGRSYLFTGHSGAGKTTVAGLAGARPVLNDETVLIERDGDDFRLAGTPCIGGVVPTSRGGAPLDEIFSLEHGADYELAPLGGSDAFWCVLSQILHSAPLLPSQEEHRASVRERTGFAAAMVDRLAIQQFRFLPEPELWEAITRQPR